jgi:hypothetical protein
MVAIRRARRTGWSEGRRTRGLALPDPGEPALVNAIVLDFLTDDPVPAIAAIRRAPADQTG